MISVQCFQKDTFRKKGDKGCNEGEGKKGKGCWGVGGGRKGM